MEELTTEVWLLSGLTGSTPGFLSQTNGTISLLLDNGDAELSSVFEVPMSSVQDIKWPKVQMSGGCSFVVDGEKYRLSFLQPQNTRSPAPSGAVAGLASIGGGRKAGKAWKALLG